MAPSTPRAPPGPAGAGASATSRSTSASWAASHNAAPPPRKPAGRWVETSVDQVRELPTARVKGIQVPSRTSCSWRRGSAARRSQPSSRGKIPAQAGHCSGAPCALAFMPGGEGAGGVRAVDSRALPQWGQVVGGLRGIPVPVRRVTGQGRILEHPGPQRVCARRRQLDSRSVARGAAGAIPSCRSAPRSRASPVVVKILGMASAPPSDAPLYPFRP